MLKGKKQSGVGHSTFDDIQPTPMQQPASLTKQSFKGQDDFGKSATSPVSSSRSAYPATQTRGGVHQFDVSKQSMASLSSSHSGGRAKHAQPHITDASVSPSRAALDSSKGGAIMQQSRYHQQRQPTSDPPPPLKPPYQPSDHGISRSRSPSQLDAAALSPGTVLPAMQRHKSSSSTHSAASRSHSSRTRSMHRTPSQQAADAAASATSSVTSVSSGTHHAGRRHDAPASVSSSSSRHRTHSASMPGDAGRWDDATAAARRRATGGSETRAASRGSVSGPSHRDSGGRWDEAGRERAVEDSHRGASRTEDVYRERPTRAEDLHKERSRTEDSHRERSRTEESHRERSRIDEAYRERSRIDDGNRERSRTEDAHRERSRTEDVYRERSRTDDTNRERSASRTGESNRERSASRARDTQAQPVPQVGVEAARGSTQTLTTFLDSLRLRNYIPLFEAAFLDLDAVMGLSDDDLKELGVKLSSHRQTILNACAHAAGGAQTSVRSSGFEGGMPASRSDRKAVDAGGMERNPLRSQHQVDVDRRDTKRAR